MNSQEFFKVLARSKNCFRWTHKTYGLVAEGRNKDNAGTLFDPFSAVYLRLNGHIPSWDIFPEDVAEDLFMREGLVHNLWWASRSTSYRGLTKYQRRLRREMFKSLGYKS